MGQEVVNYGATVDDGTGDAMHVAFAKIDAGARLFGILDKDLSVPPGSPSTGACYIVAGGATGAWAGHSGKVAVYGLGATWRFIAPAEGMFAYACDENILYRYDGSSWGVFSSAQVEYAAFAAGTLTANEVIFRLVVTRPFSVPAGMTGSRGSSGVAATGTPVISIRKNGTQVGTATWSGTSATLAMSSSTSFAIGDVLTFLGPATADASLADISLSILGGLI